MKKFLSLFITFVMLFNLTAEVFAVPTQFVSKEEENDIRSTLSNLQNSGSANTPNMAALERNYNKTLQNLAEISDTYGNLEEVVYAAIAAETVENSDMEILNNAILEQEKDLEKYNKVLESYNEKIEKYGGMENIEKQYDLYQQWLDLKPEMDQRKAELENIIKTGEDKSAKKAAKKELEEYQKNYYSHENDFNKFKKDFDELSENEEYLQQEAKRFEGLSDLEERTAQRSQEAKQNLLDLLPEDSGLSLDSDWDALFEAAQKEADKMIPMLEEAKTKFERAEAAQDNAYQRYLENKFENEFTQTLIEYCEYVSAEAEKYQRPAEYGKINGRDVAIEPGSFVRRADGTLVGDVKASVKWEKIKAAYLACTNPSWTEEKLKSWGSTVTMKELGELKYGEYLMKYGFEEGKKLSDSEKKQMGQTLARKNIGMIIVDPERGLDYYYTLYGDYNQSKNLAKYFYNDWSKYGIRNTVYEENEFGDMEDTNTYELVPTTEEGETLKTTYNYRLLNYENTRDVLRNYFYELNRLTIDIMNYLASNASNGARGIDSYLESIGVAMSADFLDIDKDIIQEKVEEINRSLSQEEKEGIVETKVTKRPFDPLVFALGPSHLVDRNRTLVRERRSALQGFDLNLQGWRYLDQKKEPQPIMDLLVFNANLQTSYRLYKPNLEAWNNLAYSAYDEEAMYFLAAMMALGQQMHDKYEEKPTQYYEEIEETFHEEGKDIILDIGVGILMGGVASIANAAKTFISSTVKVVIKNSIKVAFKSGFKQGVKAFGKRSIALTKVGLRKSMNNVSKALKGAFKTGDMKAMTNAQRSMLNPSTKANVNAFKQIKFKSPLRGTSHTLGRQQGTVFTKALSDIKAQYGIRPAKTSKVFNADLTKQQIAKLSTDLDDFYKMKKAYKPAAATPSVPAGVSLDATQIKNIQDAFNRSLGSTKYELFGQRGGVAAMAVVPMPPGAMDFLTGNATLKQIFNRNPLVTRIFNKSSKKAMKAIEKEGLNPEQARELFFKEFEGRVNSSPFMPKARKKSLIEQVTGKSMGEPTYTLGGDPKKVMIPVEDVSAKPVTAKPTAPESTPATPKAKVKPTTEPTYTLGGDSKRVMVPVEDVSSTSMTAKPAAKPTTTATAKPQTPAARAEQYFKENPKADFYLDSSTGKSFENPRHAKTMRDLQATRDAEKAAVQPKTPAARAEQYFKENPKDDFYLDSATGKSFENPRHAKMMRDLQATRDAQKAAATPKTAEGRAEQFFKENPKRDFYLDFDTGRSFENPAHAKRMRELQTQRDAQKAATKPQAPARRVSPLQENSMDINPFEKYENTSSKGGMNYDDYKYKPSATNPGVKSGLDGSVGGIQRRIMDMTSDAQSASKSAAKSSTEKTYTLGGDPKKVMVPVEDVSATPINAQVTAKPKYLGATPNANGVTILIKTPSGKTFAENISQEGLAILSRGDTINLGYATLDKDTLRFLQDIAKVDPAIAKNLKAAKKPGFFENLFGKKGVAEPAVEKTYTLGGDPKKVMVPVKENVPAKPEYLAINPKANDVDIFIKTPSGKKVSATLSREDLALLYRGETINLGEVTLDKDTLRFLQDIAKDDPIIAKNLQAAKKPSFFENLFGKKGVAEPAVEKTYTLGGDSKKVMIPVEEDAPVKSNITGKVKDPAQAYKNAYNSGVVELNENELVRFNGNGGKAVNQDYIQASKDARKYMIDAVESGEYTASADSYMQTMNEMHRVSANGKSGNLDWYKDAGQGKMSVNPGEIRTGSRPRNSRLEQAQKVEEIAKKYGDPFKVTGNSLVDLPGIPTNNLPANQYIGGTFYHFYPKGGDALRPYYEQMQRTAKEALALINNQASDREILEKLAEHYQYAANARPYGQINNSLFMNEVNTLLQKAGLRPMPHGELDIAAMHLQQNNFKKYFVDTYYKTRLP